MRSPRNCSPLLQGRRTSRLSSYRLFFLSSYRALVKLPPKNHFTEFSMFKLRALFAISLALFVTSATSSELQGKVTRVSDGDTITVSSGGQKYRIRFLGIDAPESNQRFGAQSRNNLARELSACRNFVTIEYSEKDRYGRIVGKVLCNGKDLNLEQVASSHA